MVALVFWVACTRSGCTCCHLSLLRGLQNAWATSCSNENEIMNGNQGAHVTFVWTWRRSKQRLSFCRTFHPFILETRLNQYKTCHLHHQQYRDIQENLNIIEKNIGNKMFIPKIASSIMVNQGPNNPPCSGGPLPVAPASGKATLTHSHCGDGRWRTGAAQIFHALA